MTPGVWLAKRVMGASSVALALAQCAAPMLPSCLRHTVRDATAVHNILYPGPLTPDICDSNSLEDARDLIQTRINTIKITPIA